MSVIEEAIPNQAFEIIREQIGIVLEAERSAQIEKQQNVDNLAVKLLKQTTVWKERFRPMQQDENFIIVPIFFAGNYDNQSVARADGDYQFYIDCYGRAKFTDDTKMHSDMNAAMLLQRLVGIVRYIFAHPKYIRLGFLPNTIIRRVHPGSIKRTEIEQTEGGTGAIMYRLILNVDACEEINPAFTRLEAAENLTTVTVNETARGYQYSSEQT